MIVNEAKEVFDELGFAGCNRKERIGSTTTNDCDQLIRVIWISLSLNFLIRKTNWLDWPDDNSSSPERYFMHSFLTSSGSTKSMRYASFFGTVKRQNIYKQYFYVNHYYC